MASLFHLHMIFILQLVGSYLAVGTGLFDLQCAASRLLVDLMPGLEMSIVFEGNEPVLRRLMQWAQNEQEPLKSYSVGLLGGAMEVQEIAANFKDSNAVMVSCTVEMDASAFISKQ